MTFVIASQRFDSWSVFNNYGRAKPNVFHGINSTDSFCELKTKE